MDIAKTVSLSFSLALAALCAVSPSAAAGQQTPASVDPALATAQAFVTALENADVDALVLTFAEDATIFLPFDSDPARVTGKARIREVFDSFLKDVRASASGPPYMQLEPLDVHVQHFEGMAVVTFHLGKFAAPAGETPARFGRRTAVLRQVGDTWHIVHLHASNMDPARTEKAAAH
jgi:ketosteroid isomerase-like protein